ncbi:MAG: glycoside hydrolase family 88 protein [Spirochaetaceae bacterium]|jgi:unsaturated rhamnogalacturonyl hydrolase|nr:glycoside hydrolase family 88 protein [Spirochaetaceae bacterium]
MLVTFDTNSTTTPVSELIARSVMNRYRPEQVRWHYEHGLVLYSIYALGKPAYCQWAKAMYDTLISEDGSIHGYRADEFNLDMINAGKLLFDLYDATGAARYRIALETLRAQLKNQPRTQSGGFWHKQIYPHQMWLDGLYMAEPFYARYVQAYAQPEGFADIVHQFVLLATKARDEKTGLLYHAWDESGRQPWAHPLTGCSPHFWGRALGWYCMALVDVLDFIPPDLSEYRSALIGIANSLVEPILHVQDGKTGLWYQVLDQGEREGNYLETSASAMFVAFLFKMVRKGYLAHEQQQRVRQAAQSGYAGLLSHTVTQDAEGYLHINGICSVAGLGGSPYRDGSFAYYISEKVVSDDFKGVGPFILAAQEQEKSPA